MAENDYIQIQDGDPGNVLCRAMVGSWPPPDRIWFATAIVDDVDRLNGAWIGVEAELPPPPARWWLDMGCDVVITEFEQISRSQIPDEDADEMTHVARGALYVPVVD